ncbi:MAG: phosphoribosylglycinamide formyltransferase [Bacteroidetes bacterium]|nr:phosphoribosylglycinamide formyltransferase [Bacteroidota bacterium]
MGLRVAVFASGGGSNFQALVERARRYRVVLLVCNRPQAGVLDRAKELGIPSHILSPRIFGSETSYVDAVLDLLHKENVDLIALAGYLSKVPSRIIGAFRGRILNIHPALLPRFGGKGFYGSRVHKAVLEAKEAFSGATVHFVDEEYDTGPILLQKKIPVYADDTADSLAARVLSVEHRLFPEAIHLIAQGRVQIQGRRVTIIPHTNDH